MKIDRFASRPCVVWLATFSLCASLELVSMADETEANKRFTPAEPSSPAKYFGQTIRETEPRTPSEELAGFHVPEGFRIELIASEPAISKPMNLAFDAQGKMWVTQSSQYPFPAKAGESGTDAIVVLQDQDRNGSFETSRVFADGLNIPIGLLPWGDGALCFSIPNILYLRDTDRDGVCDHREVLLGPFDTSRDTHGMVNSLRMGADGWVYACHGFNNQSQVQGKDGHSIKMTSGNVFRFRPDGSRVELFTQGQVNPFGMAQDRWGFWYAADCHSKPISQLLRGGCYPSFGRPDDGLGFIPPMMDHLHGSTAIAGLVHTAQSRFPISFQDNFLSGNVMTCRINRNRVEYDGATAKGIELPDLLTSDDPWFRPVDLQFGPDGHLYIADFYNKIIGHYEVPLDHPGRDRKSGRIWRIRWEGDQALSPERSISSVDSEARPSIDGLTATKPFETKRLLDHWIAWSSLHPIRNQVSSTELAKMVAFANSLDVQDQPQAMLLQACVELIASTPTEHWGSLDQKPTWLLQQSRRVDSKRDPVLMKTVLIALRNTLLELKSTHPNLLATWVDGTCKQLTEANPAQAYSIDQPDVLALTQVLLTMRHAVSTGGVMSLLEKHLANRQSSAGQKQIAEDWVLRIADVVDDSGMDRFVALMEKATNDPSLLADQLLRVVQRQKLQHGKVMESLASRGQSVAAKLAETWLADASQRREGPESQVLIAWRGAAVKNDDRRDWGVEKRELEANAKLTKQSGSIFSSLPLGESYTGTWSSSPFAAPEALSFYLAGHNGLPKTPDQAKNYVCLVLLDSSGGEIQELFRNVPPRSDIAKRVEWDLREVRGQQVQLRVVDGDSAGSFAWLGIGECSLPGLNPSRVREQWQRIVSFVDVLGWPADASNASSLERLLTTRYADWQSRFQLSKQQSKASSPMTAELVEFASERRWMDLIEATGHDFGAESDWNWIRLKQDQVRDLAEAMCKRASFKDQERLVSRLSKHRDSNSLMVYLCEKGSLSREALRVLPVTFWESLPKEGSTALMRMRPETASVSSRLAVVESKSAAMEMMQPDLQVGAKLFADRCALCHKLRDQGKVVGPQLEGVGARGIARLCEDILWPDRNVDEAFRMTLLVLDGGESVSGLVTERTAETLLLTDQTGKQRRILVEDIEQEKPSTLSLMPGNFDETMSNQDLASLIGYLRKTAGVSISR
jgi:putative heme-binding domain-containing protein